MTRARARGISPQVAAASVPEISHDATLGDIGVIQAFKAEPHAPQGVVVQWVDHIGVRLAMLARSARRQRRNSA